MKHPLRVIPFQASDSQKTREHKYDALESVFPAVMFHVLGGGDFRDYVSRMTADERVVSPHGFGDRQLRMLRAFEPRRGVQEFGNAVLPGVFEGVECAERIVVDETVRGEILHSGGNKGGQMDDGGHASLGKLRKIICLGNVQMDERHAQVAEEVGVLGGPAAGDDFLLVGHEEVDQISADETGTSGDDNHGF